MAVGSSDNPEFVGVCAELLLESQATLQGFTRILNAIMFPVDAQYTGKKLDKKYVEQRAKWERMYETPRSRAMAKRSRFSRPTTSLPIMAPGTSAIWTCPWRKPMTCLPVSMRAKR